MTKTARQQQHAAAVARRELALRIAAKIRTNA